MRPNRSFVRANRKILRAYCKILGAYCKILGAFCKILGAYCKILGAIFFTCGVFWSYIKQKLRHITAPEFYIQVKFQNLLPNVLCLLTIVD